MRLLAHLDPLTLEAELLDRIAAAKSHDPLAAVLVVVPSRRMADHVAVAAGRRLRAAVGIEVVFHRALATRILEEAGRAPPRPASRLLLEALLDGALRDLERVNRLAAFVGSRAGTAGALLHTLVELREAGIAPAALASAARTAREIDLAGIYDVYVHRLAAGRARGLADDAVLAAEAVPLAPAFARRFSRILHHGAYELVGANLDLIRALDAGGEVEFLLPVALGRPVSSYAEEFAARFLLPPGGAVAAIERGYASCLGERLAALYDEEARPAPLPEERWSLSSAQGASAELHWALRLAAADTLAGEPAHETALLARTWTPFASAIAEAGAEAREGGIPFDAAPALPLRREPLVGDAVAALRVVADGFPRAATAALLRSPRIDWDSLAPEAAPLPGGLAEAWSREAGIVGGLEGWTEDLPGWAASPRRREDSGDPEREAERARLRGETAGRIASAVRALATLADPGASRGWRGHAEGVEVLLARLYGGPPRSTEAGELIAPALDAARDREVLLGDDRPVPFAAFVSWLERAVESYAPPPPSRPGAIAVLDAMEARGLTFGNVHLAGAQSGLLPRIPREDPFLDDAARARIRESTGRPLAVKLDAEREERLLLALALGGAGRHLRLTWQRADEDGKAKVASPALREIARVLLGFPDAEALRGRAFPLPSHPRARLEAIAAKTGLLTRGEEATLVALEAEGREEGRIALLARMPELGAGLDFMGATESFAPGDARFDARIGPAEERTWSVTALERLGRCALQFFFDDVLRVRPLEEEPSPFVASAREIGERVHALLESVYATLLEEGAFASGDPARLVARGVELVDGRWEESVGPSSRRIARALPALHGIETALWKSAVSRFVAEDLAALSAEGSVPETLEGTRTGTIDVGKDARVVLRGRFDRVVRAGEIAIVGDYKTSGDLAGRLDLAAMLRGERLQVPLYREIADGAAVMLLGVGPSYDPSPEAEPERRPLFAGFEDPRHGRRQEEGFRETLRVLTRLPARGVFPIRPGRHCSWCAWRAACRHTHPPTVERHEHAEDGAAYRALERKTKTRPLLAEIAGAADGEDGP